MSETISVKSVLSDPLHPLHDNVANTVIELQEGSLSLCACLGPMYGEPFCPCEMKLRGLEPSNERLNAVKEVTERLDQLKISGIFKSCESPFKK